MSQTTASKPASKSEPSETLNKEIVEWAYANLKDIPRDENYANMIGSRQYQPWEKGMAQMRRLAHDKAQDFGQFRVSQFATPEEYDDARSQYIKDFFGQTGKNPYLEYPFYVDFGRNISVGDNFYANFNLTLLDPGIIRIGNNVMCAPNVTITTAGHPLDPDERASAVEFAHPVTIGNDVWIGANVVILPGVTIGDGVVIGAGAVVSRDIPSRTVAAGVPAKVIRQV